MRKTILFLLIALSLNACTRLTPSRPPQEPSGRVLGILEFSYSGIGRSDFNVSVQPAFDAQALTQPQAGIRVRQMSRESFDLDGQRYLTAAFEVTNETGMPLENLTFLGVDMDNFRTTPLKNARNASGQPVSLELVRNVRPTHGMERDGLSARVKLNAADFVAYAEEEIPASVRDFVSAHGGLSVFPYGFVARNLQNPLSRTITAEAGVVTVGFRMPLQASEGEDIFAFSFTAVVTTDTENRTVQSPEENSDAGWEATLRRAQAMNAGRIVAIGSGSRTTREEVYLELLANGYDPRGKTLGLTNVRTAGHDPQAPAVTLVPVSGTPAFAFPEAFITWDGGGDGLSWHDPLNWNPEVVPTANDTAFIPSGASVTHSTGNSSIRRLEVAGSLRLQGGSLEMSEASSIRRLELAGGTLTGASNIVVREEWQWTAGGLANTVSLTLNGSSSLTGLNLSLTGSPTIRNNGSLSMTGARINLSGNSLPVVDNAPNALFVMQSNAQVFADTVGSSLAFNNAGTLRHLAGESFATVGLNNTGLLEVQNGRLRLLAAGSNSGSMSVASGATLSLESSYSLSGTLSGEGTFEFRSRESSLVAGFNGSNANLSVGIALRVNTPVEVRSLTLSSGALAGTGELTVREGFSWLGGDLRGTLTLTLNGNSSTANREFNLEGNITINNNGSMAWQAGLLLDFNTDPLINNAPGATFEVRTNNAIRVRNAANFLRLDNAGSLRKTVAGDAPWAACLVNAGGSVDFSLGTVTFSRTCP